MYPAVSFSFDIVIDVAPNVLNLASSGTVVTVHTDIAYSAVAGATVTLNDVPITYWKSDSRGFFVAKFAMEAIEALPLEVGELNRLTLCGYTDDQSPQPFLGYQDILVINVVPNGKQ